MLWCTAITVWAWAVLMSNTMQMKLFFNLLKAAGSELCAYASFPIHP